MNHYNTTHEDGQQLIQFEKKAKSQEEEILKWWGRSEQRKHNLYPPSTVTTLVFNTGVGIGSMTPLTSVRRAMTNLTKQGKLTKTGFKITGPYGRPEYLWRYNG